MEDTTLPGGLPVSSQVGNLALSIKSFSCSRLGDVLLRFPFKREPAVKLADSSQLLAPSGSAAVSKLRSRSLWVARSPMWLLGLSISAQPGVILTLTGNMKFLLALAKTFSEMCHSQSFFLPSSPSVSLFLFPSWVSDLQCSLKTFPAYL